MKILQFCYNLIHFIMDPVKVRSSRPGFGYQRRGDKLVNRQLVSV